MERYVRSYVWQKDVTKVEMQNIQNSNKTAAVAWSEMLVNKEKGRELAEKNRDANDEMDSRSVIEG